MPTTEKSSTVLLFSHHWIQMLITRLHQAIREHFARTLSREVVQWHSDDTGARMCVCVCQLSGDWLLYLRTDWRWDLEEKLLLLCLLYGSFFTLNAENLFRGHGIPASSCLPELILAALGINKAFSGAKYAAYVLQLSSLYFPADSLLGLVQPLSPAFFS